MIDRIDGDRTVEVAMETPQKRDPLVVDLYGRVQRLEDGLTTMRDTQQKTATEIALMQKDLGYIKISQDKVTQGINRILWAIALSVLGAGSTFILSGGLVLAQ